MESSNLTAFLFPGQGQGSIKVGMGKEIYQFPNARKIFSQADYYLKRNFSNIYFFGPESELFKTRNSQLASLIVNLAYFSVKNEIEDLDIIFKNKNPDYLAGHSVGLISALVVSEAINLYQAIDIVKERGFLMEIACQINPGKMIAVLNYKKEAIEKLIADYNLGGNFNSENQIVLSGPIKTIEKINKIINQDKLGKIIPLKTEGAFHSECMRLAQESFAKFLEKIPFSDPKIPIVANSKTEIIFKADQLKKELVEHISKPVKWWEGIKLLLKNGVKNFLEIGSGDVLTKILNNLTEKDAIKAISLSSFFVKK